MTNQMVIGIDQETFEQEDLPRFGMRIAKPNSSYEVETSDSGPKHTRLVFPWFLAILGNDEHLENSELGIWSQLSVAHRDLTPVNSTLVFAPSTQLVISHPISKALIGQIRWDNHTVLDAAHSLLTMSEDELRETLTAWRKEAARSVIHHWQGIVCWESMLYKDNSFANKKG